MEIINRQKNEKKDLQKLAGISSSSIAKLGKDEHINTLILEKICTALQCDTYEITEMKEQMN
ncbi:MAG: helix-turn-helix transcriptional regulator [Treponema sp.]|jgi:DNA-binding Xre family transcriptional regulator|nr:helix-turn-helix transcriptional regulator [Treponema sp.]